MQQHSLSPAELVGSLARQRDLVSVLVIREIAGRYRGSVLGLVWSLVHPILMLAIYTFVFSVVFNARWAGGSGSRTEFALVLFAGLIVYNFFAECVNRAPSLIVANANYVKKVVFPLEILPWITIGAALFHMLVSLAVWVGAYLLIHGSLHLSILLFPVVIFPFVLWVAGVMWAAASLGVYIRDLSQVISILTTVLLFMSPIFYPASALPDKFAALLYLNPLTPVIEQVRAVLFWGTWPDASQLLLSYAGGAITAWLGFVWFQATRKGFADVI